MSTEDTQPYCDELKSLWELDHIGISAQEVTTAEKRALELYEETVSYLPGSQQYQVNLLWKENRQNYQTTTGWWQDE